MFGGWLSCTLHEAVKLLSLRQKLKIVKIKGGEKVQDYITRVLDGFYQLWMLGESMLEKAVVKKL